MESVWDKATKIIQEKISKQNFDTWIKPIKVVAMEDKCVQLSVPNKFFKDWLWDNYLPAIKHSLKNVVGIDVDVEFILSKEKNQESSKNTDHQKVKQPGTTVKVKSFSFRPCPET